MASLSTARTFGGIGSIMVLLFIIPGFGSILSIIGWILVLIAVYNIAGFVGDRSIFKDALVSGVVAIVGIAAGVLVILASVLRFVHANGLTLVSGPHSLRTLNATSFSSGQVTGVGGLVVGSVLGLVILWIFFLVSAIFLRRSFTKIATRLNVKRFATAALLYLIGAALTIVLVGFVVTFVADILMVIAFFSMPDYTMVEPRPRPMTIPPPPPQVAPA
ncbi:MAG: DUF996 domain-containing protein [Nitrososphaerales archaeon]